MARIGTRPENAGWDFPSGIFLFWLGEAFMMYRSVTD